MRGYWFLLRELVRRDFVQRYAGSLLGFLWSFVQPLFMLGLYYFVFGVVLDFSLTGERTASFALFLFAGLLPWMAVEEGVRRGTTVVTDNAPLVKKLTFPVEVLLLSVVLSALLHEVIAAVLFLGVLGGLGELSLGSLPWLLVAVPLQVAMTLGLGFLLASVHVLFRDTAQLLGMGMTAWFYFTPIVYPLSFAPDRVARLLELNPLTSLVTLYRKALFGGGEAVIRESLWLAAFAVVLLSTGWALFRRLKPTFADEI